jgi:hypothetical protein
MKRRPAQLATQPPTTRRNRLRRQSVFVTPLVGSASRKGCAQTGANLAQEDGALHTRSSRAFARMDETANAPRWGEEAEGSELLSDPSSCPRFVTHNHGPCERSGETYAREGRGGVTLHHACWWRAPSPLHPGHLRLNNPHPVIAVAQRSQCRHCAALAASSVCPVVTAI